MVVRIPGPLPLPLPANISTEKPNVRNAGSEQTSVPNILKFALAGEDFLGRLRAFV